MRPGRRWHSARRKTAARSSLAACSPAAARVLSPDVNTYASGARMLRAYPRAIRRDFLPETRFACSDVAVFFVLTARHLTTPRALSPDRESHRAFSCRADVCEQVSISSSASCCSAVSYRLLFASVQSLLLLARLAAPAVCKQSFRGLHPLHILYKAMQLVDIASLQLQTWPHS